MSHLESDQILKYLVGETDDSESFAVERHLGECPNCFARLRGLELLRSDFDRVWEDWTAGDHAALARADAGGPLVGTQPAADENVDCPEMASRPSAGGSAVARRLDGPTSAVWGLARWFGSRFSNRSPRLAWVGIGLLVLCVAGFLFLRPGGVLLEDPGGTLRVLADGTIRLAGGMRPDAAWQDRLAPVMRGEPFALTSALDARLEALRSEVVRLGSAERPAPTPLSPVGVVVRSGPVRFGWGGVEGATNYTLVVSDGAQTVVERPTGGATNVILSPPDMPLVPGAEYEWQVAAVVNGEVLGCSPVRFAVLDAAAEREIAALETGAGRSGLVMAGAALYYGLFDEAARRVDELRRLNPGHPIVARLEQAIADARRVKR